MGQKLRKLDASTCFPLRKRTSSAKPATSENLHKLRRERDRPNRTCRHAACTIPPTCLDSHPNGGKTSRNIRSKTKPPLSRPMPLDRASQLSESTKTKAAAGCGWIAARRSTASQRHYQRKPLFFREVGIFSLCGVEKKVIEAIKHCRSKPRPGRRRRRRAATASFHSP